MSLKETYNNDNDDVIDVDVIDIELLDKEIKKKSNLCKKNSNNLLKKSSVLQEFTFFSENNINIQSKIKEIPFFTNYFHCFHEYCCIDNFNEINEVNIEKWDINKKYILIKYLKENKIYFNNYFHFLYNNDNLKIYIKRLIETYSYLLKSIIQLDNKKICYFYLNNENIYFNSRLEPIIENFEKSIDFSSITFDSICKIIESFTIENFRFLPLEIFIIHYLNKYNIFSLSLSVIEDIYEEINKTKIFNHFNENIHEDLIHFLSPLINKTKVEIVKKLLKYIHTWDNYCLSLLYIEIIHKVIKELRYDTKYHFLSKWMLLLKKNISNNPSMRETLKNTQEEYMTLLENI